MRRYSLSVDSDAHIKIENAAGWYNYRLPGLGEKFRDLVYLQFNSLRENPERHTIFYRDVRRVTMDAYPYTIHYIIEDHKSNVRIYDFIDDRRGPHHHPRQS